MFSFLAMTCLDVYRGSSVTTQGRLTRLSPGSSAGVNAAAGWVTFAKTPEVQVESVISRAALPSSSKVGLFISVGGGGLSRVEQGTSRKRI